MAAATLVLGTLAILTLSGTPGNQRRVNLPTGCRYVKIRPRTNNLKVRYGVEVTEDDAIAASDYETVDGDSVEREFVGGRPPFLALSSATASLVVEITALTAGE